MKPLRHTLPSVPSATNNSDWRFLKEPLCKWRCNTKLMGKGEAAARRELMELHGDSVEIDV